MGVRGHTKGAVIAALMGNGGIAVAKLLAGIVSGSVSILAEAAHSIADTFNQVFLLIGLRRAGRPADALHPFGYGKARFFWSFVTAVMLFALGGFFSVYEGVSKILEPSAGGADVSWGYLVLGIAFVFESASLTVALRARSKSRRKGRLGEMSDTTLLTVLFEDAAALVGLVLAFFGLWLSDLLNEPVLDGVFSVFIGILLFGVALFLANVSRRFLLGRGVPPEMSERMREVIGSHPCVSEVKELLTMYVSPDDILLVAHVTLTEDPESFPIGDLIEDIEHRLRKEFPGLKYVFIEPEPA